MVSNCRLGLIVTARIYGYNLLAPFQPPYHGRTLLMLFGLFPPSSPLPVREKAWTEVHMRWLARQFGADRLLKAPVVLPDDHWFPEPYDDAEEDARRLLHRIGDIMQVATTSIRLEVCADEAMSEASGHYEPGLIRVGESELADPPGLVAVLAHELAHGWLVERGLSAGSRDVKYVADLLPVYLGLGVFMANATVREMNGSWRGRHGSRRDSLNSCTLGYALALFAWVRGERRPDWAKYLRLDARHALKAGLRYLRATEDSLFTPETCATANRPVAWHALLEQIERGSNSARVAGLWELVQRPRNAREDLGEATRLMRKLLHHRLPIVRAEAAVALGTLGQAAEPAVDDLLQLLDDTSDDVRSAAAHALGRLGMRSEEAVPNLAELLDDRNLVQPAALAIAAFGPAARSVVPGLVSALVSALMEVEYSNVDCLVHAIEAVALEPPQELAQVLAACDAESRPQAEHMLAARHPIPTAVLAPSTWFGQ